MTEAIDRFSGILGEARGIAERLPFTEGIGWDEGMHNFKRQMLAAELLNIKVELERQESARMRDPNKFPRLDSALLKHIDEVETHIAVARGETSTLKERWRALGNMKDIATSIVNSTRAP
jgi:hypothetical protein